MKRFLKTFLLLTYALALDQQIWGNLVFGHQLSTLLKVGFILSFFELILKPIIKILLLPINILTLGLFRIVINTLGFYLSVFLLADFEVKSINTPVTNLAGISIPALYFTGFLAYLVTTVSVNLILSFFRQIIKPKKENK